MIVTLIMLTAAAAISLLWLAFQTLYVQRPVVKLPGECQGTVVQLTDIHGRIRFINGRLSRLVNGLQPDLVMVTGDLASRTKHWPRVLRELERIECRKMFFVPGNYERETVEQLHKRPLTSMEYTELRNALRQQGIAVLENQPAQLSLGQKKLLVYGFDNSVYGNERVNLSAQTLNNADYTILLAHSPTIIDTLDENRIPFDLLLAGHTHGGQIRLFGRTIGAYKNYHVGLKKLPGRQHFYIGRGLGTVKIPLRVACPPEITVFKLGEENH
ncbi:metallophosphoesterase [Paenibacillus tengchongensis]|uniref:metallophosphoesterase n=1 Tax=Paenibacillus tengchongensis TaxID=2608684 RepID=UPI00124BDFC9|nr:metallophosphoesterase [Paenibacillus tengchongensis]